MSKAIIQNIKQAFDKNAIECMKKVLTFYLEENVKKYFIFPDGTIKTVIEDIDGKLIGDTLLGTGG